MHVWSCIPFEGVVKPRAAFRLAREKQMHEVVEALALDNEHIHVHEMRVNFKRRNNYMARTMQNSSTTKHDGTRNQPTLRCVQRCIRAHEF